MRTGPWNWQRRGGQMMAPQHERARVLNLAIEFAANELSDPIDKITVFAGQILIVAGSKRIELSYTYHNAYSENGAIMPGSGNWDVSMIGVSKENWLIALLRRICS